MAEENQDGGQQQQMQLLLDERELRQIYTNSYRINATPDEVIVDLGFNMPNPNTQPNQPQQILLKINDRVVMSYLTAKRLSLSLSQVVRQYEQRYGELVPPGQGRPTGR